MCLNFLHAYQRLESMQLVVSLGFLLILLGICCPVAGQQKGGLSKKENVVVKKHRRDSIVHISESATPLKPAGDFRLKRFGWTPFEFDSIAAKDSFSLVLLSKAGVPFKTVQLSFDTILARQEVVDFQYRDAKPVAARPVLKVKAGVSLKRTVANIQVRRIARPDAIFEITDSLSRSGGTTGNDTATVRHLMAGPGPKETLIRAFSTMRNDSGGMVRRSEHLVVQRKTVKPERLAFRRASTLKKTELRYDNFEKGDTLVFAVNATGKTPLKEIYLYDPQGRRISGNIDALAYSDTIVAGNEPFYSLHIKNKAGWKKQYADVSVLRIRPVQADSFYTVIDSVYQIKNYFTYDTLLLTIADDSLFLAPLLNIESEPFGCFELLVPKMTPDSARLSHVVYWMGIGRNSIQDYQTLEATVPQNWSRPGAPVALGAYGMGRPLIMPGITTSDVTPAFNKTGARIGKNAGTLFDLSLRKNTGILSETQLKKATANSKGYRFFACFQNKSAVNTYPVQLKMIAYYRKEQLKQRELQLVSIKTHPPRENPSIK